MSTKVLDNEGLDQVVGGADVKKKEYTSTPWSNETIQELKTNWTEIGNDYALKMKKLGYKKDNITADTIADMFQVTGKFALDVLPFVIAAL